MLYGKLEVMWQEILELVADSSSRMGATWLSIWSHGCFSILSPLLGWQLLIKQGQKLLMAGQFQAVLHGLWTKDDFYVFKGLFKNRRKNLWQRPTKPKIFTIWLFLKNHKLFWTFFKGPDSSSSSLSSHLPFC